MNNYNLNVNNEFKPEIISVGNENNSIVIIDNFFESPNDLIRYAKDREQLTPVATEENFYPGVTSDASDITDKIYTAIKPIIKQVYGLPVAYPSRIETLFGMINITPDELNQMQRIPHYDAKGPGRIAVLAYLCHPPHQGTGLYRHIKTGFESIQTERYDAYWDHVGPKLKNKQYPDQYANNGNDEFEKIAEIPLVFNRLAIYQSQLLHSSIINPELLSEDLDNGRLTLRTFISYQ